MPRLFLSYLRAGTRPFARTRHAFNILFPRFSPFVSQQPVSRARRKVGRSSWFRGLIYTVPWENKTGKSVKIPGEL